MHPCCLPCCSLAASLAVFLAAPAAAEEEAAAGDQEQHENDAAAAGEDAATQAVAPAIPKHLVKRIMLTDDEVQRVSADAVWLVGEAARLFLQQLAAKGAAAAAAKKRKTIKLEDFEHVVRWAAAAGHPLGSKRSSATSATHVFSLMLAGCFGLLCLAAGFTMIVVYAEQYRYTFRSIYL
jgi:histone H3/H4